MNSSGDSCFVSLLAVPKYPQALTYCLTPCWSPACEWTPAAPSRPCTPSELPPGRLAASAGQTLSLRSVCPVRPLQLEPLPPFPSRCLIWRLRPSTRQQPSCAFASALPRLLLLPAMLSSSLLPAEQDAPPCLSEMQ